MNDSEEFECDKLSNSLLDIEESFKTILNEQLPKLFQNEMRETGVDDLLFEIGEELRHILYHIKDPKFYKHLHEE